jgi:hypothetical protein
MLKNKNKKVKHRNAVWTMVNVTLLYESQFSVIDTHYFTSNRVAIEIKRHYNIDIYTHIYIYI